METSHNNALLFQVQSFFILMLIYLGVNFKRQRKLHVRFMSFAIVWDILLVLQIELSRDAITKAAKVMTNAMILNIHVAIATTTVILYFFMIYTGRKLLKGQTYIRPKHRVLGITVIILRTLTFITSFFALPHK